MKFQLATDSIDMMLKAMHCIRDQFSTVVNTMLKFVLLSGLNFILVFAVWFSNEPVICCQDEALNGH